MKFRNKKTGEIIEGTEQEMEEVLSELEKTGEIVDSSAQAVSMSGADRPSGGASGGLNVRRKMQP